MRLGVFAIAAGTSLGALNLVANSLIASSHQDVRAVMVERMATAAPIVGVVSAPIVEEVGIRLFLLSALVWTATRMMGHASIAFGVALSISCVAFALPHLDRPMPADPAIAAYYQAALLTKYTLLAAPLGWIFWRWGLPYAILAHAAANATHIAARSLAF